MRFAVVGHVEWVDFLVVSHVPISGEIVSASDSWSEAAGGGAVAAVQLAKLAGSVSFFTALGDDDLGRRSAMQLRAQGVELEPAVRATPQRRAVTFLDARGERTIITIGPRLVPASDDELPWDRLTKMDGLYFTGGDPGALRAARAARVLVATPRARPALEGSGVELDALVRSASDASEQDDPERLGYSARLVVTTEGAQGGSYIAREEGREGRSGSFKATALPGPVADTYGAGDSFAAGLTYALGAGMDIDAALQIASHCGAGNLTARGPYAGQPTAKDLDLPASDAY
jgi:ribokinase